MTIIEVLNYINSSLKSTAKAVVEALTSHTYKIEKTANQKIHGKVDVTFPKNQKISGVVKTNLEEYFINLIESLNETKESLKEKGILVNNFPEIPKEIRVSNFPKEISVSNFPKENEIDFSSLEKKIDQVNKSIKKLPTKFPDFPKIKIPGYPIQKPITFPKSFEIDNLESLKSDSPKDYVPVRLTDGEEFYKAIEEFYQQVSSAVTFTDSQNKKTSALVDEDRHVQVDVLTAPPVTIDTSELATSAKQSDGSQVTKVLETIPTDATKNNSSTLLSFNAGGELVYADETIGTKTYRTTFTRTDMVIDSTLPISAVVEL